MFCAQDCNGADAATGCQSLPFGYLKVRTWKHSQVYCGCLRSVRLSAGRVRDPAAAAAHRHTYEKQKASSDTVTPGAANLAAAAVVHPGRSFAPSHSVSVSSPISQFRAFMLAYTLLL